MLCDLAEEQLAKLEKSSKKGKFNSEERRLYRKKLPDVRKSETHKFSISGHEGYLTYSFF